mmetsp:Transcript_15202/g.28361  ORF Transcript_15202/g.28361 Transcript_15202/m.28361 type:complete len:274 (-) Transcript_15202:1415-2236(-)
MVKAWALLPPSTLSWFPTFKIIARSFLSLCEIRTSSQAVSTALAVSIISFLRVAKLDFKTSASIFADGLDTGMTAHMNFSASQSSSTPGPFFLRYCSRPYFSSLSGRHSFRTMSCSGVTTFSLSMSMASATTGKATFILAREIPQFIPLLGLITWTEAFFFLGVPSLFVAAAAAFFCFWSGEGCATKRVSNSSMSRSRLRPLTSPQMLSLSTLSFPMGFQSSFFLRRFGALGFSSTTGESSASSSFSASCCERDFSGSYSIILGSSPSFTIAF